MRDDIQAFEKTVAVTRDTMPSLVAFLEASLDEAACPPAIATKLLICLDEIASNVVKFSQAHDLTVRLEHCAELKSWELSFSDDGTFWNPLTHDDPDITLSVEDRPIGGLGLLMVKKMMDDVSYSRENERNVLRLRISA